MSMAGTEEVRTGALRASGLGQHVPWTRRATWTSCRPCTSCVSRMITVSRGTLAERPYVLNFRPDRRPSRLRYHQGAVRA